MQSFYMNIFLEQKKLSGKNVHLQQTPKPLAQDPSSNPPNAKHWVLK